MKSSSTLQNVRSNNRLWTAIRSKGQRTVRYTLCLVTLIGCHLFESDTKLVQAVPITFQGTGVTDDVQILSGFAGDNFGGSVNLDVGNSSGVRRSLLRFPTLSSDLSGEVVASATLILGTQLDFIGSFTNQPIFLHTVTTANADWAEGAGTAIGSTPDDGFATWSEKVEGSTGWAGAAGLTAGVDYVTTPVGSFTASNTDTVGVTTYTVNFSDVSFLQNWIDNPAQNGGFFLLSPSLEAGNDLIRLSSSEGGFAPLLSIELAVPVPEPSGMLLLSLGLFGLARHTRRKRQS